MARPARGCASGPRTAGKLAFQVASKLRSRAALGEDEAHAAVRRVSGELAGLADKAARDAEALLVNAKVALRRAGAKARQRRAIGHCDASAGRRQGRLARAVNDLSDLLTATRKIAVTDPATTGRPDTARRDPAGHLHDPHARPIAKGRLGKPVEFGDKAQVADNDDGIVLDHDVALGNPPDAPRLAPAIERISKRAKRTPRTVTADRGYNGTKVENDLHDLGVGNVVIPRTGKPGKARQDHERRPSFRREVKRRTGCEGRVSNLKRNYGWERTRIDTLQGAQTWAGYGILAHNLIKISALVG